MKDLPDDSDGDLSFIMTDWKNLNLERKSISQSNLQRFPCKTGDKYLTCVSEFLHRRIRETYGCKLSFLDLGHFMQTDTPKLPECSKVPNFSEVNEIFSSNYCTFSITGSLTTDCTFYSCNMVLTPPNITTTW